MEQRHVERKLAAILAADVVGYSRLIGVDELGTLDAVKSVHRELINPAVARHHGRVVKLMGDGLLAAFGSAVEAVACAAAVQHGLAQRNAKLPAEQHILLRCGINLGDVVVEGNDIFGDGVNVAARLESLCEPGAICISRAVRDQVRDKLVMPFKDRGEHLLKNIARPVRVFQLPAIEIAKLRIEPPSKSADLTPGVVAGIALKNTAGAVWQYISRGTERLLDLSVPPTTDDTESASGQRGACDSTPPRLSIVVLPFTNVGGDSAQSFFADALTADITTDLSRIADSFVISASTAFTYKDRQVDPKQIGKQLGVRYVLQGSVRRAGDHARVNVELIDTTNGTQIWAERFDHDVIDSAAFQDHVTSQIGRELGIELVEAESRRSGQRRPESRDAVDFAMQGWSILNQPPDRQRMQEARAHFEASLSRDAALVSALVGLALTYVLEVEFWAPSQAEEFSSRAEDAVNRALALDFKASYAHQVKARIAGFRLQISEAAAEARRAIELDRNDWKSHVLLSLYELMAGHPELASLLAEKALRLSPRDPGIWAPLCLLGRARVVLGEAAAAIDPLQQAVSCAPGAAFLRVFLAAAYGRAGYENKARACISEFLRISPDLMVGQSDEVQMIMRAQLELAAQGYYLGLIDGRLGPMNHQALVTFQREHRISETGEFDEPTLSRLKVTVR